MVTVSRVSLRPRFHSSSVLSVVWHVVLIRQRTWLEVGAQTVAVLGCGLDIVYPPNLDLYKQIAVTGAVASEFPFGRRADRSLSLCVTA